MPRSASSATGSVSRAIFLLTSGLRSRRRRPGCVLHSASGARAAATIALDASVEGDSLEVVVCDSVAGLVRGPIRGGGRGLGMQIVRQLADWTDLSSSPSRGLRVVMRFALPAVASASAPVEGSQGRPRARPALRGGGAGSPAMLVRPRRRHRDRPMSDLHQRRPLMQARRRGVALGGEHPASSGRGAQRARSRRSGASAYVSRRSDCDGDSLERIAVAPPVRCKPPGSEQVDERHLPGIFREPGNCRQPTRRIVTNPSDCHGWNHTTCHACCHAHCHGLFHGEATQVHTGVSYPGAETLRRTLETCTEKEGFEPSTEVNPL